MSETRRKTGKRAKRRASLAQRADRFILYQQAVQCVEAEIDFVDDTFRVLRRRRAGILREDFCGTANTSCEWVRRRAGNEAIGVDLDPDVLAWAREHNIAALAPRVRRRVTLLNEDVRTVRTPPVDVVLAMNFSYWILKRRKELRAYFRRIRDTLSDDGVLFLDAYGGHESFRVIKDRHPCDGFTYIWDQASYNPITGDMICHIHFSFPDGSRLRKAFSYDWRLWTLPEIRELLAEARFSRVTVHWQGADEETGEGNGVFEPREVGEPDPAWIAYVVAEK